MSLGQGAGAAEGVDLLAFLSTIRLEGFKVSRCEADTSGSTLNIQSTGFVSERVSLLAD
jgi:hypothetical protein